MRVEVFTAGSSHWVTWESRRLLALYRSGRDTKLYEARIETVLDECGVTSQEGKLRDGPGHIAIALLGAPLQSRRIATGLCG